MPAGVVDDRLHLVELLFPLPDQMLACELLAVRKAHLIATIRCSPVVIAVKSTSYEVYLRFVFLSPDEVVQDASIFQ